MAYEGTAYYSVQDTPPGQMRMLRGMSNTAVSNQYVFDAVGANWYGEIVWRGVNGYSDQLPPRADVRFVFEPKG
jgi:hypothetical protein